MIIILEKIVEEYSASHTVQICKKFEEYPTSVSLLCEKLSSSTKIDLTNKTLLKIQKIRWL